MPGTANILRSGKHMKTLHTRALVAAGILFSLLNSAAVQAQNNAVVQKLDLHIPLADFPQNGKTYPSMQQSLAWSNTLYDGAFWGIDALGNTVFHGQGENPGLRQRALHGAFDYALGFAFAKYGSELPVPLGVWSHEEFHRSVLGVNGIKTSNGNWLLNRWDGTVYGASDQELGDLKENNLQGLLYAYTAGIHSENLSTRSNLVHDVYHQRSFYKNPLYLYNAAYVWNYFRFATSAASDSVKVLAPPHESTNPKERDFAGADITAWAYDMFNPNKAFSDRDDFPNGEGENRRVGFSDLSQEARNYLVKQKKLSLLNFVNPAIFCINRFNSDGDIAFNVFLQYAPTHFGNDVSVVVPVRLPKNNLLFAVHNYNNHTEPFFGLELGLIDKPVSERVTISATLHGWSQPKNQDFYSLEGKRGGAADLNASVLIARNCRVEAGLTAKTEGWMAGNAYLGKNISFRAGFSYSLNEKTKKD